MTTETTNGHAKGRKVPPLPTFTFRDSGHTVAIRKLSPMTLQEMDRQLRREFPPPEVPVVDVPDGDDGQTRKEANPADPDYQQALVKWQQEHYERAGERTLRLVALRAVEVEVDADALVQLRKDLAIIGTPLPDDPKLTPEQNEKYLYVMHILIGSPEDMQDLQAVVMRRSQPTQEAVSEHIASFRNTGELSADVSGA